MEPRGVISASYRLEMGLGIETTDRAHPGASGCIDCVATNVCSCLGENSLNWVWWSELLAQTTEVTQHLSIQDQRILSTSCDNVTGSSYVIAGS